MNDGMESIKKVVSEQNPVAPMELVEAVYEIETAYQFRENRAEAQEKIKKLVQSFIQGESKQ